MGSGPAILQFGVQFTHQGLTVSCRDSPAKCLAQAGHLLHQFVQSSGDITWNQIRSSYNTPGFARVFR
jgi:hypothetical protein